METDRHLEIIITPSDLGLNLEEFLLLKLKKNIWIERFKVKWLKT